MKHLYLALLLVNVYAPVVSQQQYALLIGINDYEPLPGSMKNTDSRREWPNLEGCQNDVLAIKNEIVAQWGFSNNNIYELYNRDATRQHILQQLEELLKKCKKGDVAFIYYAGHGSQVINTLSAETDKLDESIVPADAWKPGVEDIRDKTLAPIMNRFVDKGVLLTVIYDCCHSGSLGKGFQDRLPKIRYIKRSNHDAMDSSNPPAPESKQQYNYLALFASQENEPAQEQKDDNDTIHGAFTLALLQAMEQQGTNASVTNIFNATRAILKSNGKNQEPVISGISDRQLATLFGLKEGTLLNRVVVPVLSMNGNLIEFQGGFLQGLNIENELTRLNGNEKVKITSMIGANRCEGTLVSGNREIIQPGQLFEVSNWVSPTAPFLKIYVPPYQLTKDQLQQTVRTFIEIQRSASVQLVSELQMQEPDIVIYYDKNGWMANGLSKDSSTPIEFSAKNILQLAKGQSVFINIPPSQSLKDSLNKLFSGLSKVELVSDPNNAQYYLAGSIGYNQQPAFSLVRSQARAKDSLEVLPVQTASGLSAKQIFDYAMRLSKIRAWLNIKAPHQKDSFPIDLEWRDYLSEQPVTDKVKIGKWITMHISINKDHLSKWDKRKRYLYVFEINNQGKITTLFPDKNSGNQNNQFPADGADNELVFEKTIVELMKVSEPAGAACYFLLATEDEIPNFNFLLEQDGVGGKAIETNNALEQLIKFASPQAKEFVKPIPGNWNITRTTIQKLH